MSMSGELPHFIGKYEIKRVIGRGAMGTVYEAFDPDIERVVGIKVLHAHLLEDDGEGDFRQRFIQEAKSAARCHHPNIVTLFDFGVHESTPYIVMEYIDGTELKDQLREGKPFSLVEALGIVSQILEALASAHQQGVVHRDIKPANIMLMDDGRVKVSDFGVAKLDNTDLTSTGMMVGTPNYMSPEGLNGKRVDGRADLYSVGVVLFELLTNQRPFKGVTVEQSLEPLDQCNTLNEVSSEKIKSILARALQPKEEERFQKAGDFLDETIAVMSSQGADQETVIYQPTKVVRLAKNFKANTGLSLHPDVLSSLERSLVTYVGPTAKVLVRKHSKKSLSLKDLVNTLAKQIPQESERAQFLNSIASSGIHEISLIKGSESDNDQSQASGASDQYSNLGMSPEKLKLVTSEFAYYIGPLASRIVKKVFTQTASGEEFYNQLAGYIPEPSERQSFLSKVK